MKKKFNITGLCIKEKHYMVDTSDKIKKIIKMVDDGEYFTINRPRQFGKTTTLNTLRGILNERYLIIDTSFEGVGDSLFSTEEEFCGRILKTFATSIKFTDRATSDLILKHDNNINNFQDLSQAITDIIIESGKQIVLFIDEVDKSSNSKVFLQFLGVLRSKYLAANSGKDITFKSVILAGVHDIKNLKLAVRDENESRFNSPWNISSKFDIDMSFDKAEIKTMLIEYQNQNNISFDEDEISELIHQFTNGYPYLVSDICKIIDEKLKAVWNADSVYLAIKTLLNEKNTLFEDVIKNIENNDDIKFVITEILINGKQLDYHPMTYDKGIMYGLFTVENNKVKIYNSIFETYIYNYLITNRDIVESSVSITNDEQSQFIVNGKLDLEKILLKFQNFMFEEYRQKDKKFYEAQARLIFLAYLKPILNGKGFYFVEPETRENKRLDIVIIFGVDKYVLELKLWNGQRYEENGRIQLAEYLDIQSISEGYLLIFNFNKNKKRFSQWITVEGKNIFEVIV